MWKIVRIDDADYGCEERMPGEPLMVLVTIEREDGITMQFEVTEDWIELQTLEEGDEWPEEIEEDPDTMHAAKQSEWMEGYYRALQELDEINEAIVRRNQNIKNQ